MLHTLRVTGLAPPAPFLKSIDVIVFCSLIFPLSLRIKEEQLSF